jgi:hypothetical protein
MRAYIDELRGCYLNGLAHNPKLRGGIRLRFTISATGAVSAASNSDTDLADPQVVACVVRTMFEVRFPAPRGGRPVVVVYPIKFQP